MSLPQQIRSCPAFLVLVPNRQHITLILQRAVVTRVFLHWKQTTVTIPRALKMNLLLLPLLLNAFRQSVPRRVAVALVRKLLITKLSLLSQFSVLQAEELKKKVDLS